MKQACQQMLLMRDFCLGGTDGRPGKLLQDLPDRRDQSSWQAFVFVHRITLAVLIFVRKSAYLQ